MTGGDAVQVLPHADVAEVGTGIGRVAVGPQAATMLEPDIGKFRRDLNNMRVEVAK